MRRSTNKKRGSSKVFKSRRILKDRLWAVLSAYVRLKNADKDLMCKCITCGVRLPWRHSKGRMQCGHFIPRLGNPELEFELDNLAPQCSRCNGSQEGMQYIFGLELEKKLGKERVMEMVLIWRRPQRHLSMEELQQLYDYYSKLLAKEIKRRNLVYKI